MDVMTRIGSEVFSIVVFGDACPMGTGAYLQVGRSDPAVAVVEDRVNLGWVGAVRGQGADIVAEIGSGILDGRRSTGYQANLAFIFRKMMLQRQGLLPATA